MCNHFGYMLSSNIPGYILPYVQRYEMIWSNSKAKLGTKL